VTLPRVEGRLDRVLTSIGSMCHRYPWWIVGIGALSLIVSGFFASELEVKSSFLDLLPPDEQPVRELREVLDHARSTSDVVIAIGTENRAQAEDFARALAAALEEDEHIAGVGGYVDRSWFLERRLLFVPQDDLEHLVTRIHDAIDGEVAHASGFDLGLDDEPRDDADMESLLTEMRTESERRVGTSEFVQTQDARYIALWAYFSGGSGDLSFGAGAWSRVRDHVDALRDGVRFPRDLEVRYAGAIPSRVEDERVLLSDLGVAGVVGFVAVVLLIVLSLRSPRALILISVPLFTGLLWTFAFARLAVGHLNIISGFLFSILSGLGIEYAIHLLHRYREFREEGLDLESAIEKLVKHTGRALLSGSMTNAAVFAVIAFAQFDGFSEFGSIAAAGLILTLIACLFGVPALLVLSERMRPMAVAKVDETETLWVPPTALRIGVVVAIPLFASVSLALALSGQVTFDGNWRHLVSDTETTRFSDYLRHQLSGTYDQALLYVPETDDLPAVEEAVSDLRAEREAAGESFVVVDVVTLNDVYPALDDQEARLEIIRRLGRELDRVREGMLDDEARGVLAEGREAVASSVPFGLEDMPYSLVGHLMTRDGRGSIVHLLAHESDDANTALLVSWSEQATLLAQSLDARGVHAAMLSENWIAGEIFQRIADDATFLSIATVLAVLLVLLFDLRRPLVAILVLSSVLLGVLMMAGVAWMFGVQLNFMNVAILPVCMSISLDNAIHVYHRWREGGAGSIPSVLRHTTRANALASMTNLLGFAALILTHHEGLRSVAWLASIGVLSTYVSTTIFFPLLLHTVDLRYNQPFSGDESSD